MEGRTNGSSRRAGYPAAPELAAEAPIRSLSTQQT